ncbi:hypothetical protein BZB76_0721 [Actinomadura pelletieri DSM 43383]|uniref:HTH cro/C1-type domain-containing protein n=1 Tax=Actinomadura pelletieri DSM 43383 TaxID=1120940 RepID=A0A495QYI5_9ACTN|nr:hypothetical protein [Actinomadura pelletieri]RKS79269.1 hypothetical protein BZB76_0721 [Actinomadura pelletieri DSM 43383]
MSAARKIIGARLREIREADPYWSRGDLARLMRTTATPEELPHVAHVPPLTDMIKQWEAGKHTPGPRYRRLYARVTGKPEADLFGTDQPAPSVWRPDGLNGSFTPDDEERLILAAARPVRTDMVVVRTLATILAAQRRLEDSIGSAPLIAPTRAQLAAIEDMIGEARAPVRGELLDVAGQWAQFAGWLHTSNEQYSDALACFGRALEWATEIDDRHLIGSVLSWRGYIAERRGQIGSMIGLSQAGQRVRRGTADRVTALYQEARARALLGEATEVDRLTETAAAEAEETQPAEARPWEYYYERPGIFGLEHGLIYRILGRTDRSQNATAVEHLNAGLNVLSADMRSSEWAGAFLYQLALAYRQAEEPEEVMRVVEELERIVNRLRSDPLRRRLDALR